MSTQMMNVTPPTCNKGVKGHEDALTLDMVNILDGPVFNVY